MSKFVKENTSSLRKIKQDPDKTASGTNVSDLVISEDDVYKLLSEIDTSKACGPDEVPGGLLKEGAKWIAGPLSKRFSLTLAQESYHRIGHQPALPPSTKRETSTLSLTIDQSVSPASPLESIVFNHMTKFLTKTNSMDSVVVTRVRPNCWKQFIDGLKHSATTTAHTYTSISQRHSIPSPTNAYYSNSNTLGYGVNCLNGTTVNSVFCAMGPHLAGRVLFRGCHKVQYLAPFYSLYMSTTLVTTLPLTLDYSQMTVPSPGTFPHSKTITPYKKT